MNSVTSMTSPGVYVAPRAEPALHIADEVPIQPASPEPSAEAQISPTARALAELFDTASAFVQKEHFEPCNIAYKYNSAGYLLNEETGYLDIEKYNNYLFDKAASNLVDQAKQLGLSLNKDEVLSQLKADNAEIAAIHFNNTERVKYLGSVLASSLTYMDVQSLTDMYITAKENGLGTEGVSETAFYLGIHNHDREQGITWLESDATDFSSIQHKIDMAEILKEKLASISLGFKYEKEFFDLLLNPRIHLGGLHDSTLDFLSKILDIYSQKAALKGEEVTMSADRP